MRARDEPAYQIEELSRAFESGRYSVPARVRRHMGRKGWPPAFLLECVMGLSIRDFHKSQPHATRSNVWLDIYRPRFGGCRKYFKVVVDEAGDRFVVLSFCDDGEAH